VDTAGVVTLTGNLTLSGDANEGLDGGGLTGTDCDNATTSKLLYDDTTNKFSCGTDQNSGGATAWDAINDPSGAGAIAMNEFNQTLDWNTAATAGAFDGLKITVTNDATTDSNTQRGLYVDNLNDGISTGTTESLLTLDNSDANEVVTNAIEIIDGGGGFTNIINNNGTLISSAELNALDNGIETADITNGTIDADDLDQATADGSPADEECLTFETSGGGDFEWQACGGSSGATVKIKTADESAISDTTLNNDSELTFAVGASENWVFQFNLDITTSSSSTPDFRYNVTAPSSTFCRYMHNDVEGATGISAIPCANSTAWAVVASVSESLQVVGAVQNVSAGTVAIRWAQSVSSTFATTVRLGSVLRAFKTQGADLAEYYNSYDTSLEAGDVVAIDSAFPGGVGVKKTSKPYDVDTLGVVSMEPGLVLADSANFRDEGRLVAVGLAGRVPVKVTTENGTIKPGDYLTPSSIPGVAMKATKAGSVVGQALIAYAAEDPSQIGTAIMFIKTPYFRGSSLVELLGQPDEETEKANFGRSLLAKLVMDKKALATDETLSDSFSELFADRVAAGIEIITPKVLADEVEAHNLIITTEEGENTISFDNQGNAFFAGTITAEKIHANQIEGLNILAEEILTNKLIEQEGLIDIQEATSSAEISPTATPVAISIDNLTAKLGLTVLGPAEFSAETIFKGLVSFEITPIFNKDTAGFALIKQDGREVEVKFEQEYAQVPVVTANALWDVDQATLDVMHQLGTYVLPKQDYIIANITTKGFKIILEEPAVTDLKFSWIAIGIKDARTVASDGQVSTPLPTPTPTSSPESIIEEASPTPSVEPTPEESTSPTPTSTQ
jgi:hypothetical protein